MYLFLLPFLGGSWCFCYMNVFCDDWTANYSFSVLPKIIPFEFGSTPIYAGQAAQITCFAPEGDQPLELFWSFEGDIVTAKEGIQTNKFGRTSTLLIDPTSAAHTGNYTCIAKNAAGVVNHTAALDIFGMPHSRSMKQKARVFRKR